jgi:hypothetical protein
MLRIHICFLSVIKIWSKEICAINRAPLVILGGYKKYFCIKSANPSTDRKYLGRKIVFP